MVVGGVGEHMLRLQESPTGQEFPQKPQFCASYDRLWQLPKQAASPS